MPRLAVFVLFLSPINLLAQTSTSAYDDPILRAMSTELQRSKEKLQLEQMQRPYYIEYSVTEVDEYTADATLGVLRFQNRQLSRSLRTVVRVGNYKRDSFFRGGQGQAVFATLGDDQIALRHQLWLATDSAYKNALAAYSAKDSMLKSIVVEYPVDDFSEEPPVQAIGPLVRATIPTGPWAGHVRAISALFRKDNRIDGSLASFTFRVVNRYFMNTEGTVTRRGSAWYVAFFFATTQAPDGQRVSLSRDWVMARPEELPSVDTLKAEAEKTIATMQALRQAPQVDETYRGPVLFGADAAKHIFWTIVGPAVTGDQPPPGNSARTTGSYASQFKTRVLPDFLTIVDDPTASFAVDRTLVASYQVDDEGVKAQPVTVVDKGLLVNYLLGRRPIRDFPHSNGHGRASAGDSPAPQFSNLFVKAEPAFTFDQLKQKLIELCRNQGLDYGYFVESTTSSNSPLVMYKVWVKDGRQELVRDASFHQLDARALRGDIVAAGNDTLADNSNEAVPKAVINPSILFGEMEIRRTTQSQEKLPEYPPPALTETQTTP
ncbi:MAG: metallopeptidase TldD-related protein [Terriglobales bacterium]